MDQGRIKWYSVALGYGFIIPDDHSTELLVRHEDIVGNGFKSFDKSARVTYEAVRGREGMEAKNVSKV